MALGVAVVMISGSRVTAATIVFLSPLVAMFAIHFLRRPKLHANWVDEQAQLATGQFDGEYVTIKNYRHTIYRSLDDYDVQFLERRFDLSQLCSIDFIAVPFSSWRGIAHVFVSFGFSDGEYLAVSVEARRKVGESYSPLGGLYQQYEMIYVFGDERDIVAKRALFQKNPVHLYPMISTPEYARMILVGMLESANDLAVVPEFYNTVTNTCTSNVLNHTSGLKKVPRRYDFRLVFPGYADGLAVETGLIEAPDGIEALREATLINRRAEAAPMGDGKAWSRAIRAGETDPDSG
ncbi:MAG: DUF4105 domain-containing protein [Verrucomicrobiales bacterium]